MVVRIDDVKVERVQVNCKVAAIRGQLAPKGINILGNRRLYIHNPCHWSQNKWVPACMWGDPSSSSRLNLEKCKSGVNRPNTYIVSSGNQIFTTKHLRTHSVDLGRYLL